MKSGLEFMTVISLDGMDVKRKLVDNVVNGISLIVLLIDF